MEADNADLLAGVVKTPMLALAVDGLDVREDPELRFRVAGVELATTERATAGGDMPTLVAGDNLSGDVDVALRGVICVALRGTEEAIAAVLLAAVVTGRVAVTGDIDGRMVGLATGFEMTETAAGFFTAAWAGVVTGALARVGAVKLVAASGLDACGAVNVRDAGDVVGFCGVDATELVVFCEEPEADTVGAAGFLAGIGADTTSAGFEFAVEAGTGGFFAGTGADLMSVGFDCATGTLAGFRTDT